MYSAIRPDTKKFSLRHLSKITFLQIFFPESHAGRKKKNIVLIA